jgi:hypothetical protein
VKEHECRGSKDKENADELRFRQTCQNFCVAREKFDEEAAKPSPEKVKRNL